MTSAIQQGEGMTKCAECEHFVFHLWRWPVELGYRCQQDRDATFHIMPDHEACERFEEAEELRAREGE